MTSNTEEPNKRGICRQYQMTTVATTTLMLGGMNMAFSAVTYPALVTDTINSTMPLLSESDFSWFASISALMAPVGGLVLTFIFDRFGRKKTFYSILFVSLAGWSVIATASNPSSMFVQLLIGRALNGISHGMATGASAVYLSEIAHANLRGRIFILLTIITTIGILIISVLGYFIPSYWRTMAAVGAVSSLLSMLCMLLLRESPRWLISKDRLDDAERSLKFFRNKSDCKLEMNTIIKNLELESSSASTTSNESLWEKMCRPEVYKPLAMLIGLGLFQQYSGLYTIVAYGVKFSLEAGVKIDPFLSTIGIAMARMIGSAASGPILDRYGRKWPTIASSSLIGVCLFVNGGYISSGTEAAAWLPVVLIFTIIFASSFGLLTIPYLMIGEIFPLRYRGLASGLGVAGINCATFSMLKMYPAMVTMMGTVNVFYFFGSVSLVSVLYVHFLVLETRGKTLEEIELSFRKK